MPPTPATPHRSSTPLNPAGSAIDEESASRASAFTPQCGFRKGRNGPGAISGFLYHPEDAGVYPYLPENEASTGP